MTMVTKWESITTDQEFVRRLPIQGGWLYQVQSGTGWSSPVFVPAFDELERDLVDQLKGGPAEA